MTQEESNIVKNTPKTAFSLVQPLDGVLEMLLQLEGLVNEFVQRERKRLVDMVIKKLSVWRLYIGCLPYWIVCGIPMVESVIILKQVLMVLVVVTVLVQLVGQY